jgi:hypothetical protein
VDRVSGKSAKTVTRSIDVVFIAAEANANTARSCTNTGACDAGAASLRSIEQLFSQPVCLRSGQEPEVAQQQAAHAEVDISASDGSVIAARSNAVKSLRTGVIVDL